MNGETPDTGYARDVYSVAAVHPDDDLGVIYVRLSIEAGSFRLKLDLTAPETRTAFEELLRAMGDEA